MKLAVAALVAGSAAAFAPASSNGRLTALRVAEDVAAPAAPLKAGEDLEALAKDLNPVVKFWDPLNLAEGDFWGQGNEATVGFLRQAEIKHSRVAMAAFVGYVVQSNFVFPWANTLAGDKFPSADLSPEAQWDALPQEAKWQIILVVGFLELWDECGGGQTQKHYMRGGRPGDYPTFQAFRDDVHFVLDLYDPFGFSKKMDDSKKARRLNMEINNGRLAMIGIFGFMAADKVEGSVPALKDIAIPYDGDIMAPFGANFSFFN